MWRQDRRNPFKNISEGIIKGQPLIGSISNKISMTFDIAMSESEHHSFT